MNQWLYTLLFFAVMGCFMYLMYRQGYMVSKCIRAVLFMFTPGRDRDRATLNACSGWVRHGGTFRESRTYTFVLDAQLTKGDAEAILLDGKKQPLLRLNRFVPTGSVWLDARRRYFIRWEFRDATGTCALHW